MIVIIDYGMGNLGSVENMIRRIGAKCMISGSIDDIATASKLILPGVGRFDQAMLNIKRNKIMDVLIDKVNNGRTPILGICLGMQILCNRSEEGSISGLKLIDADVKKFRCGDSLKIPHMGWNTVNVKRVSELFEDMLPESRFYFVHSYHVECYVPSDIIASASYGYDFTCALNRDNIYGVQFHPEKSHKYGMKLLRNFVELV